MKLIAYTLSSIAAVIALSGCTATTHNAFTPIESTAPLKDGTGTLIITSPQDTTMAGEAFVMMKHFDYYMDCLDDSCKISNMHKMQYTVLTPSPGAHTLYAVPAGNLGANSFVLIGKKEPVKLDVSVENGKRKFISHEWKFSLISYLAPIVQHTSVLSEIDESTGMNKLQTALDKQ